MIIPTDMQFNLGLEETMRLLNIACTKHADKSVLDHFVAHICDLLVPKATASIILEGDNPDHFKAVALVAYIYILYQFFGVSADTEHRLAEYFIMNVGCHTVLSTLLTRMMHDDHPILMHSFGDDRHSTPMGRAVRDRFVKMLRSFGIAHVPCTSMNITDEELICGAV